MSLIRRAFRPPIALARETFNLLPSETRKHACAATREGWLALRALADGAPEATERIIDRIGRIASGRSAGSGQRTRR